MDTTYHPNIPIETLSLLDCDVLIPFHMSYFSVPKPKS